MEHRLILGGEQFLPFARSRIKALRALGIPYADQSFEVDGVSIKVRVETGHEYIRLEGGTSSLALDSGFVDGYNLPPLDYSTCTLYETASVAAYNAAFSPTDPISAWREKISNPGAISGTISWGIPLARKISGKVQYDSTPAKSYSPGKRLDSSTPPVLVESTQDDALYLKKVISAYCRPSIFTGKCRLYVQSLYGAHLHDAKGTNTNLPFMLDDGNPNAAPALRIDAYNEQGDTHSYDPVVVNTSCGVYLDKTTGKHWLIKPVNGGEVWAYPLLSSGNANKLRKLLVTEGSGAPESPLNDEDREHLESFILASCLPDVKNKAVCLGGTDAVPAYSMGYGWHWNWDGNVADLVENSGRQDAGFDPVMVSTHHRLSIIHRGGDWIATLSVVEGPKEWAVERLNWCITEPLWSKRSQVKTTPKYSRIINCDAPFYAFYSRNSLQVCRVSVSAREPDPKTVEYSDGFLGATATRDPKGETYDTIGLLGGHVRVVEGGRDNIHNGAQWVGKFTVGQEAIGNQYLGRYENIFYREIKDKALSGTYAGASYDYYNYTIGGVTPFTYGYPDSAGNYPHDDYRAAVRSWTSTGFNYTYRKSSLYTYYVSTVTIIVPLDDSEAVFMQANQTKTTRELSVTDESWQAFLSSWGITRRPETEAGIRSDGHGGWVTDVNWVGPYYTYFVWKANGVSNNDVLVGSASPPPTTTVETLLDYKKLIAKDSVYDATFSGLSKFHDNSADFDEIDDLYAVVSGTKTDTPTVYAIGRTSFVGANGHSAAMPVLLGWV